MIVALLNFYFLFQALTPEVIEHAQAGADAQKQGRFAVAIQEFRKVVDLQPNSASGHANLGESYFQNKDIDAAIPELTRALEINPNLIGTQQTLGVALLVEGDAASALPHLEKARTPELLGLAYLETGRFGSAIMALHAALERQPADPDLLYYFGKAANLAGKRTQTQLSKIAPAPPRNDQSAPADIIALQTALAKSPDDPHLLFAFQRAAALASQQAFDKILQTAPGSARAHQVLAERNLETGNVAGAEKEYARSLALKPYTAGVHLALGNVFLNQGNAAAAVRQFREEATIRPASAEAAYRLGAALLQEGNSAGAVTELARADRLRPDTPAILLALGRAAFLAGDNPRAEKSWLTLLAHDKSSDLAAQAQDGLEELYRKTGQTSKAGEK